MNVTMPDIKKIVPMISAFATLSVTHSAGVTMNGTATVDPNIVR